MGDTRRGSWMGWIAGSLAAVALAGCGDEVPTGTSSPAAQVGVERLGGRSSALVQGEGLPTGPICTPNGGHAKHAFASCTTCHMCGGVLQFDPSGPAVATGKPAPTFDATAKTCSNVACHTASGTWTVSAYSYNCEPPGVPDSEGGCMMATSYPYGGGAGGSLPTPSWYATGGSSSCGACHGMPPTAYAWHSGQHGYPSMYGTTNACQTCHPDATGLISYDQVTHKVVATNVVLRTGQSQHRNGTLEVTPLWTGSCFGCH